MTLDDCAASCGLASSTVREWVVRGDRERTGPYRDFAVAIRRARADGSKMLLARIALAGTQDRHWQANAALLAMTEPQYAPKVRVAVEEQLTAAADRLSQEFASEPGILRRALRALAEVDDE